MGLETRFLAIALLAQSCGVIENMSNTLEMEVEGHTLFLDGTINTRASEQFQKVLEDNPQLRVVVFGKIDGSLDDKVVAQMGYALRDQGLNTRMPFDAEVYSGGVDLFLAGVSRVVEPGAVLGVHEWQNSFGSARDYAKGSPEHEPTRGYIEDMLGSDAFYWFSINAAPFDGVYIMTRNEMQRYAIVTR